MKFISSLSLILLCALIASGQASRSSLLAGLNGSKNLEDRIQAYSELYYYYQYSQPDSALFFVHAGLSEFNAAGQKQGIAAMTTLVGIMDANQGRIEMAQSKQEKALALFEEIGNKKGAATVLNSLGVIDGKMGNFEDATRRFVKALSIFEALKDTDGIALTYLKLGVVNEKSFILDKALECYNKVLHMVEQKGVIKGADPLYIYNNIGIVYAKMGRMDTALPYFERALAGSNQPDKTGLRLLTLNNLGIVFDKTGNDKKSLYYFDEALKITRDKNMPEDFARTIINRSAVIGKTDPAAAIKTLEDALKEIQAQKMLTLEADLYDQLVNVYNTTGRYKEAFITLAKLRALEDSLESTEKAREIMNLQSVHELEQSNTRLALLEERNESNRLVRNMTICIAVGLAVLLAVVLMLYRKTARLNARLSAREAELRKTNEMKDRLFSIIGHDLRGPIGNVPVMLQLMEEESTSAEEKKYLLETLIVHTRASTETLDKLLYWGQAQLKGIGMKQSNFNTGEAIENNLHLTGISAGQKQISIVNRIPAGTSIFADPAHFDFIMRNLLSNAVKFTHPGGTVTLNADSRQKPGYVVFSVADTGIGISRERQQVIFKPFASSTRGTADEKGTSIGLMLCKEFVNENGGEIWVTSEEGKGSTFFFTLKAGTA